MCFLSIKSTKLEVQACKIGNITVFLCSICLAEVEFTLVDSRSVALVTQKDTQHSFCSVLSNTGIQECSLVQRLLQTGSLDARCYAFAYFVAWRDPDLHPQHKRYLLVQILLVFAVLAPWHLINGTSFDRVQAGNEILTQTCVLFLKLHYWGNSKCFVM